MNTVPVTTTPWQGIGPNSPIHPTLLVHTSVPEATPKTIPTPTSSPDETAKPIRTYKWTTIEKIKETAQKLRAYIILLRTVNEGINVMAVESSLPELKEDDRQEDLKDIAKANRLRNDIKATATAHVEMLRNYIIYLRGTLEEIAGIDYQTELEAIAGALNYRKSRLTTESGSPPSKSRSPAKGEKTLESPAGKTDSPTQSEKRTEPEIPEEIKKAWDSLEKLTELRVKLNSLFDRFTFVRVEHQREDQAPSQNDRFAVLCRKVESIDFNNEFNAIDTDLPKELKGKVSKWHPTELAQIALAVANSVEQMKRDFNKTSDFPFHYSREFMSSDENKLYNRLSRIKKEFELNSGLSERVQKLRQLNIDTAILRERVFLENNYEYNCDKGLRAALHQRNFDELERLREEFGEIDIPGLISKLNDLRDTIESASDDLNNRYESVVILERKFDEKVRKLDAYSAIN